MNHFKYRDNVLFAEDVDLPSIAEAVGTPCYVYSRGTLERHWRAFDSVFEDRKSTRLNSSHGYISYAVSCLKNKYKHIKEQYIIHKSHSIYA